METFTENWVLWITSAVYKTFAWKYFPSIIVGGLENIILFVYHDAKTLLILMDKLFSRWKERHIGYEEKLLNLDVFAKKGFVYDPQNKFFFFLSGSYILIESFFSINVSSSSWVMYISWIDWERDVFQLHWMYIWDISFIFFVLILLNLNFLIWMMLDLDLDALICKLHVYAPLFLIMVYWCRLESLVAAGAGITEVIFVSWFSLLR